MNLDMTKGSPLKLILKFLVPVLLGCLFQQLYNMVDTIIVGKGVGSDALAAVGATGTIVFFILGFMNGLTTGFTDEHVKVNCDRQPAGLSECMGAWYDRFTAPKNVGLSGETFGLSKDELQVQDFMELVEPAGAKVLAIISPARQAVHT